MCIRDSTTGVEFKLKHGLDYEVLMRHEHVNSAKEIREILDYFFEDNTVSYYGLGHHLSFYQYIESSKPKLQLAQKFLEPAASSRERELHLRDRGY